MKFKNLEINWKAIKRGIAIGFSLAVIFEGIGSLIRKSNVNNNEAQDLALLDDEITYNAPEGYTLETINGKVQAVREIMYVIDATEVMDSNGNVVSYTLPEGYTLNGTVGYKIVTDVKDPIIVKNHNSK